MRTYLSDIIPKIQKFSKKLDNLTLLTNQHWVAIDDIDNNKNVYIFRQNNDLLISQNGKIKKARWEYLGHNSILIDLDNESYLFKYGFVDENILALKIDSKEEYAIFVNEAKFEGALNSFSGVNQFLKSNYTEHNLEDSIKGQFEIPWRNDKELNPDTNHMVRNYKLKKVSDPGSIFRVSPIHYLVDFDDGLKGEVFHKSSVNQAYFIEYNMTYQKSYKHYYENINYCIVGLYSFLKRGELLQDGYIEAYV